MEIINPIVESYSAELSSPLEDILIEIEQFTLQTHTHAHMLSGKLQGKLLQMISMMVSPSKVLEIGTFTGFSALCLLKGLRSGGKIHTIEVREEDARTAAGFFKKAKADDMITLHIGDAKQIIPVLNEAWDLVFIDADKVGYIDYYELTLPSVRAGGWILADNVFFHGLIFEENISGKNARAIRDFNEHVAADNRVEQVILSVRDGLMLIRKK